MLTSVTVPSKDGHVKDIVLGFDNIDGNPDNAIPIVKTSSLFISLLKDIRRTEILPIGTIGFDKFVWDAFIDGTTVYLTHVSQDDFEGYPGTVLTTAECTFSDNNEFAMRITAVSNKPTIINMSNHSYFNLAGHDKGCKELYKHKMTMNADKISKISEEQIPTGEFLDVGDTEFDFRLSQYMGDAISKTKTNGFDHNFCITSALTQAQQLRFVARVIHPESGRTMEVYSDQPNVLFYTSNNLPDPCGNISPDAENLSHCDNSSNVVGKNGALYKKHGAFCLETQNFPDAVHHDNFPSIVLNPGKLYRHEMIYKFGVFSGAVN
ncbi:Galactose mutarotase [Pseudolycoriella hygida]|uniref:Galactose mutarotase n=1 Tax=Pseudolycoriella hygida TaxID=35572 RepID=A0A9Q0MRD3_9DIPT|nr:Galactose mutarotase [Pseudolycoriella hygida]